MFCEECGNELVPGSTFCSACGTVQSGAQPVKNMNVSVNNFQMPQGYMPPPQGYMPLQGYMPPPQVSSAPYAPVTDLVQEYVSKLNISAAVWITIGILQIIVGGYTLIAQTSTNLFYVMLIGFWNVVNSIIVLDKAKFFEIHRSGMAEYAENQNLVNMIVMCIWNAIYGGIIGIVAAVFEIMVYTYGKDHIYEFRMIEENKNK